MLVAIGMGTYSDGIYTFDFETHSTNVVEWYMWPTFLEFDQGTGTYWAGFENEGRLLSSADGTTWEIIPDFLGKNPSCIAFYGEHIVISVPTGDDTGIYHSEDGGETWTHTVDAPLLSDLAFNAEGWLLGIFPSCSNSSGLWASEDFGETWNVVFWSDNMSSVAFDNFEHIFVGWKENEGVAIYNPGIPPPGLTFLNEGLPSLNINDIQTNPWMSAPAIFVCTQQGAWYSIDYMVGIDQPETIVEKNIVVTPNPASDRIKVQSNLPIRNIRILTMNGAQVLFHTVDARQTILDISTVMPGVYLIMVNSGGKNTVEKIIVR
jgi:hypothetical protein